MRSRTPSSISSGRTRTLHPDFGPPPFGIPYVGVGGGEPRTPVTFVDFGDESDRGFGSEPGYPIPEAAKTPTQFHRRRAWPAAAPQAIGT